MPSKAEEVRATAIQSEAYQRSMQPLLKKYCFECHKGSSGMAGIQLDQYPTALAAMKDRDTWQQVLQVLQKKEMPPGKAPQPSESERKAAVAWIESVMETLGPAGEPNPGRVTARRLNRAEYTNTIRDLLGVRFDAAADFPADDVGYGFDNIGDVLSLPPVLLEKYMAAAEKISAQALRESHDRIIFQKPGDSQSEQEAAARKIVRRLATRAYRRKLTDRDQARLMRLVNAARRRGESFEGSIQFAIEAILISPSFLFRVEIDPKTNVAKGNGEGNVRSLNDYELAARLSYFLWSSMPDEELFFKAVRNELHTNVKAQVKRMLSDPKSKALAENFAGQWLQLRRLTRMAPNAQEFPAFDEELRTAMRIESEMFFTAILHEDRSVLDFVDADFTFLNERLARHYGIPGVHGDEFRRVDLRGEKVADASRVRGGVITQASMLTVTSNPTRTSPVKRGKWILENILGTPPPDPPPNIPALLEDPHTVASGSLRQRMELHRQDAQCAVCHRDMDSLGFALQNFDGVGAWRTRDGSFSIDAKGELPEGQKFDGAADLKALLRGTGKQKFARCLTEKMLTYALGRGLEPFDRTAVDRITQSLAAGDYKFSTLILEIVQSDPFQKRFSLRAE